MEKNNQPEKMCDCIIFRNDNKIIIVELKSSSLSVGKIIEKFTNSGKKSISLINSLDRTIKFDLFFVLLAKNYSNQSAYLRLRRSVIKIHGKKYPLKLKKCGCFLEDTI